MARPRWQTVVGALAFMALGGLLTYVAMPKVGVPEAPSGRSATAAPAARVPGDVLDLTTGS